MLTSGALVIFSCVFLLNTAWLYQVNLVVPEPYLDEVFHVHQAQAYCAGTFRTWDPKITTPPGLYIVSYVFLKAKLLVFGGSDCGLADLRWLNSLVGSWVIPTRLWDLHRQLGFFGQKRQYDGNYFHSIINICLFPLLFFFSALYYTDVCSVSFVLGAYDCHLRSLRPASTSSRIQSVKMLFLGLYAIFMRQTNIFWVAIFLAGLHAVHHVKRGKQVLSDDAVDISNLSEAIYDPPISEAYLEGTMVGHDEGSLLTSEDYFKTIVSLAAAALRDPVSLLQSLWPYLSLLGSFAVFVLINGGVVLGNSLLL